MNNKLEQSLVSQATLTKRGDPFVPETGFAASQPQRCDAVFSRSFPCHPPRVAVFVDGANFYYMQRDKLQWWIDCRKLLEYVHNNFGTIANAVYYTGKSSDDSSQSPEQPSSEDSFLHLLLKLGYALRCKPVRELQADGDVRGKANMDVEITLDMVTMQNLYDVAVLVSGDGDFVSLVEYLQRQGKQIVILSTAGLIARQLREVVGSYYVDVAFLENCLKRQE